MRLIITVEQRFFRTPDGAVWTEAAFPYDFWTRYLEVFDQVRVIARSKPAAGASGRWRRADGAGVHFWDVPYYVGPLQYAARAWAVERAVQAGFENGSAVILRVASQLANCLEPLLVKRRYPFGLEVVNDPHDVFGPKAIDHPLRPFFQRWFRHRLRVQCKSASGVAYVTREALQRRYPAGSYSVGVSDVTLGESEHAVTSSYSSVDLWNDAFIAQPRRLFDPKPEPVLICVATMMQPYKAQDVLLGALRICHDAGLMARLVLVGDGKYRASLERLASRLRLSPYVEFRGTLAAGEKIRRALDSADVFVLPSRVEGLPRALIEAMARGLPCIGSNVGGIPELLGAAEMVPADDPPALAAAISALARDGARMAALSSENWRKALEYRNEILAPRRRGFYDHIRSITLQHVEKNAPAAGI